MRAGFATFTIFLYVYNRIYASTLDFFILSFERRDGGFRDRERKRERARVCPLFLSLTRAIGGEMIQTESPSFFNASARVCMICVSKILRTRVAPKKKNGKKKLAHQITCETLSFLSLSLNCVALFF